MSSRSKSLKLGKKKKVLKEKKSLKTKRKGNRFLKAGKQISFEIQVQPKVNFEVFKDGWGGGCCCRVDCRLRHK